MHHSFFAYSQKHKEKARLVATACLTSQSMDSKLNNSLFLSTAFWSIVSSGSCIRCLEEGDFKSLGQSSLSTLCARVFLLIMASIVNYSLQEPEKFFPGSFQRYLLGSTTADYDRAL